MKPQLAGRHEESEVRVGARGLLERVRAPELLNARPDHGTTHDPLLWTALAEAGWLGLWMPEDCGGSAAPFRQLVAFHQEAGRALVPTTLLSSTYFSLLIEQLADTDTRQQYLPRIASGEFLAAVADAEPHAYLKLDAYRTRLDNATVTGTKDFVRNASQADALAVLAREGASEQLIVAIVDPASSGVAISEHLTVGHDSQALVSLNEAPAVATLYAARSGLDLAIQRATCLQAAELLGAAEYVLELTLIHVRTRHQFGRAIGSFQAVQHLLADLAMRLDGARLLMDKAAHALEGGPAALETSRAKARANDVAHRLVVASHHLHGGMGYVREGGLYLWSQRQKAAEQWFGSTAVHLKKIADLVRPAMSQT